MTALRPVFILLSRFWSPLYMNTPGHAGEVLAQLAYPDPSALAQDPAARDELWKESADLTGLPVR
jgi:hypothetical protein